VNEAGGGEMKGILLALMALAYLLAFGAKAAQAQQGQIDAVSLDTAIQNSARSLAEGLESGASIAVLSMGANSPNMSGYLIDMMIVAFEGTGEFTVMDRAQLDLLAQGTSFPTDQEVEAAKARSVGRLLAVDFVVTGAFEPVWGYHRFRVSVIQVRGAGVLDMDPVYVHTDNIIGLLLGQAVKNHFTGFQRWGTFFLNFLPGLGSFAVMNDSFGGSIQLALGTTGLAMFLASLLAPEAWQSELVSGGLVLMGIQLVFNIARSYSHMRRAPIILEVDPWMLNTHATARGDGLGRVSLFYTLRF